MDILKKKCSPENLKKLEELNNPKIMDFVSKYAELCNPDTIFVSTDTENDAIYIKNKAIEKKEEIPLKIPGHTVHFDGINDQGRDPKNTKFLFEDGIIPEGLNGIDRQEGLKEIYEKMKNIMIGREMIVCFYALGPIDSPFYIPAVQLTDSYYVAHSENILYRKGYEAFKKLKPDDFFKVVHGMGPVDERMNSIDIANRRIYMDLKDNLVFSCNTQYAGNTVGFKKLTLRLAIKKASEEGWLAEHMFVMGVKGPNNRKSYFSGAFPSMCGKTSTAMVEGETIIGDDIAYLRVIDGKMHAANVEKGIFGIIQDINESSNPLIWEVLNTEGDIIFSNVLVVDGIPYWLGDKRTTPEKGINFSGEWFKGKVDENGNPINFAHKNARYVIDIEKLKNCDENLHAVKGVELKGIIYGGRDSNTSVPVVESFNWDHGVITLGGSLESETTAATIGTEGKRVFNIMSNIEFLSISIADYMKNYLEIKNKMKISPKIFGVNYFQRTKDGVWLTGVKDKMVWLKWMELRSYNDVEAIEAPIGYIPKYEDLKQLFTDILKKEYTVDMYKEQFTIRIPENLAKMDRIINIYKGIKNTPEEVFIELETQKKRLNDLRQAKGDYVTPDRL